MVCHPVLIITGYPVPGLTTDLPDFEINSHVSFSEMKRKSGIRLVRKNHVVYARTQPLTISLIPITPFLPPVLSGADCTRQAHRDDQIPAPSPSAMDLMLQIRAVSGCSYRLLMLSRNSNGQPTFRRKHSHDGLDNQVLGVGVCWVSVCCFQVLLPPLQNSCSRLTQCLVL